jgi:glucose-1-phosphate adenylyltransferase
MDRVLGIITANYATKEMGELTEERTIASLPYGGRYRLIDFPLSNMVNSGIHTVGLITPYKYRSIIDHVGAGKEWSLDRKVGGLLVLPGSMYGISSPDSRFLLRDLSRNITCLTRSQASYVIMTSANTVCNMNYKEYVDEHIKSGADITMIYNSAIEDDPKRTSIKLDGDKVVGIGHGVRKGDDAFLDCFVTSRDLLLKILDWYSAIDYLDLFEVLADDYDKMDVRAIKHEGYARSIFNVRQYFSRSMDLLKPEVYDEVFSKTAPIMTKVQDAFPTKYLAGAKVKNSLIPSGCIIEGNVENSILFRGVKVGKGATIKNSIIMQSCVVGEGAVIEDAVIDRSNVIGPGMIIKGSAEYTFVKQKNLA